MKKINTLLKCSLLVLITLTFNQAEAKEGFWSRVKNVFTGAQSTKKVRCPSTASSRLKLNCSSVSDLKNKTLEVKANLFSYFKGDVKNTDHLVAQLTDGTYRMVLGLHNLCEQYNQCLISDKEYSQRSSKILDRFTAFDGVVKKFGPRVEALREIEGQLKAQSFGLSYHFYRDTRCTKAQVTVHHSGDEIKSGECVMMEISATKPVYLYVANLESQGGVNRLYPSMNYGDVAFNQDQDHYKLRLPPRGYAWRLDDYIGREEYVIIASEYPLYNITRYLSDDAQSNPAAFKKAMNNQTNGNLPECRGTQENKNYCSEGARGVIKKKTNMVYSLSGDGVVIYRHVVNHTH